MPRNHAVTVRSRQRGIDEVARGPLQLGLIGAFNHNPVTVQPLDREPRERSPLLHARDWFGRSRPMLYLALPLLLSFPLALTGAPDRINTDPGNHQTPDDQDVRERTPHGWR